jgi:D-alanyl-D-alanine carboxypeptidase
MRCRPTFCALALAVACSGPAAGAQESPLLVVLDSARLALDLPGASAAMLFADGTSWEGASGLASPGIPVASETAFEVGSITKLYTATLVLGLVAEGRFELEDPLMRWFPEVPGAGTITIRHLLNHTHGLHDPLQEPDFIPAVLQNPARTWALDDVLERMRDPVFEPGAGWRYSNTGYHLLGAIVEAVTGSTFADLIRSRLLDPFEFDGTWYGASDPDDMALAAAYIDPSGSGVSQPVSLMIPWTAFRTSAGPAGAVVATAPDAARFLHALATGTVLPGAEWQRMQSWVDRPDGNRHGLGVLRIEDEHRPLLGHKGNAAGYSASAFHDPSTGTTAVVLTNGHAVDVTPIVLALLGTARQSEGPPR